MTSTGHTNTSHSVVVRLKGGLGNQMFQYASARGIACRNNMELVIDNESGFARDKVYRRTYSLGQFPITVEFATKLQRAPFLLETAWQRLSPAKHQVFQRPWGLHVCEMKLETNAALFSRSLSSSIWLDGYFQTEAYFEDITDRLSGDFRIPAPKDRNFLDLAEQLSLGNSVAVGLRLYEEVPNGEWANNPLPFCNQACRELAKNLTNPVFYVFCTYDAPQLKELDLPGEIRLVTHDNGFNGELARLWLLSRFKYHVFNRSSFYWWGAWLAERLHTDTRVIASSEFPPYSLPDRWTVF